MIDVVPEILENIDNAYTKAYESNSKIRKIKERIKAGKAGYEEAHAFAMEVGKILTKAFEENITSSVLPDGHMYYNIAKRTIEPMVKRAFDDISDVCEKVQTEINSKAGIKIKTQRPDFPQERIDGIINRITSEVQYE